MTDYSRLELLSMRTKLQTFSSAFRSIVKAHSINKHANYVVLPKTLLYGLMDDLDALTAVNTKPKDSIPYCMYDAVAQYANGALPHEE